MIEICNITQDFYFLFFAYSVFGTEKKNQSAKCDVTLPSLSDCVCVSRPPHPFPLIFGMRTDPLCSCTQQLSGLNSSAHTKTFLALLRHLLHLMGSFRLRVAR